MHNIYTAAAKIDDFTSGERKNWRKLLQFGETLSMTEQRSFLWSWPTEENLEKFKQICAFFGINNILSIGCGSGLLEWILKESIGISIHGLEIDRSWWTSGYAVKSFIDLNYIDENESLEKPNNSSEFLQSCAKVSDWQFALLFCYFNNHKSFLDYVRLYKGDWIIIIGPIAEIGIHTEPSPLEPNFSNEKSWHLQGKLHLCHKDIVAFYKSTVDVQYNE